MKLPIVCVVSGVLIVGLIVGCHNTVENRNHVVQKSRELQHFHRIFPDATSSISVSGGFGSSLSYLAQDVIYERYLIYAIVDLKKSYFRNELEQSGEVMVYLCEIQGYSPVFAEGGGYSLRSIGAVKGSLLCGIENVDELFLQIDVTPVKDAPFDKVLVERVRNGI